MDAEKFIAHKCISGAFKLLSAATKVNPDNDFAYFNKSLTLAAVFAILDKDMMSALREEALRIYPDVG